MKNIFNIILILALTITINAQTTPPSIQWEKCYGGTDFDWAKSIQQTQDGGYIVAGYSYSNDGDVTGHHVTFPLSTRDYWVVKIDTVGNIQWQKSLGGTGEDYGQSIRQTNDGGYIVAGYSYSNDGDVTGHHYNGYTESSDYWVVKLDTLGNIQWEKSLGGTIGDNAYSIQQTNEGGYIVAGISQSNDGDVTGYYGSGDYWVVKLDTSGNILWQKCLGGTQSEDAFSIEQTVDGGYVVAGYTSSNNYDVSGNHNTSGPISDYWIVKLDTTGNIQWQKCLGGTGNDEAYSIQQTKDSGYIVAGRSFSNNGNVTGHHGLTVANYYDYWVVKIDSIGNIQWQKSLGGTDEDEPHSIWQTTDGGYIVAGTVLSNNGDVTGNHGGYEYWIVKIDISGNIQWQKSLGGTSSDNAYSIQQTNDGGYIVAGISGSNDGDITGPTHGADYWIVKLGHAPLEIKGQKIESSISIYPNPANRILTVNFPLDTKYVEISNSLGQVIEKRFIKNQTESSFDIKESGIYFVQVVTAKETITKKLIIEN